ncbi:MAG: pyruvate dehydrogenase complex dihydrolipoamide acetyltransferase [Bauldia sp.]|nr:pyruvate dehydrogenase complex dihydrolipoamide acetyltransferase [Bauldia sp.]
MPTNILMPALSPTMEEGKLAKWLKKEGDAVKSGDVIAEIETDKATMEVEAVDEGTVGQILVPAGTEGVKVNAVIAVLLGEGESAGAATPKPPAPAAAPASTAEAPPLPAAPAAASAAPPGAIMRAAMHDTPPANGGDRVFASPLARRLAKEAGIDVAAVKGSGPQGRVVKADIEAAGTGGVSAAPAKQASPPAAGTPAIASAMSDELILKYYAPGTYDVVPHDSIRKVIARRLTQSKQTVPHFYLTVDTEIDALLALRAEINAAAPEVDGKPKWRVSVNDMIIKAMAGALVAVPEANATWTEGGMLRHHHADIGVAVAIEGGLITPVVRNADGKTLSDISNEMKDLAKRARDRKLTPEEYQGGATSISNLGMYGVRDFAAVINPPQSSILAVGAGVERPIVRQGEIVVATIMTVTLSTDHRAVDGALAAELLKAFKRLIEKPTAMLL